MGFRLSRKRSWSKIPWYLAAGEAGEVWALVKGGFLSRGSCRRPIGKPTRCEFLFMASHVDQILWFSSGNRLACLVSFGAVTRQGLLGIEQLDADCFFHSFWKKELFVVIFNGFVPFFFVLTKKIDFFWMDLFWFYLKQSVLFPLCFMVNHVLYFIFCSLLTFAFSSLHYSIFCWCWNRLCSLEPGWMCTFMIIWWKGSCRQLQKPFKLKPKCRLIQWVSC